MKPNFHKSPDGLVPAVVQDADTRQVLMLGYMNEAALAATISSEMVTFYSRSRQRLWTKGETSGNFLRLVSIVEDCDSDALLVEARPAGHVCHTGSATCFGPADRDPLGFLNELESVIAERRQGPGTGSYVARLFSQGINKIAQKVGEESVETVIAAKDDDIDAFKNEAADLLFHYLLLLQAKGTRLGEIADVLRGRRR